MPRFHITISSASRDQMMNLNRVRNLQVLDHGARRNGDLLTVHAIAEPTTIRVLEGVGYDVAVFEDVDEAYQSARAEVGEGNRFLSGKGYTP